MQQPYNIETTADKNLKTQFTVNVSDTPVTLKQGQGHQTQNNKVDPQQDYNSAKFEKSHFKGVQEKAEMKVFFK